MLNATTRIFVGNIPYDFDENELVETMEMVGPLKDIEIKIDENNNKPKGFGFCTYKDSETRVSALNNLKNMDYNGRQLRINTAENEKNILVTEESIRSIKDLIFIPSNFNSFYDLSRDQKNLLMLTLKILYDKDPKEFYNFMLSQDELVLKEFLSFQTTFVNSKKSGQKTVE